MTAHLTPASTQTSSTSTALVLNDVTSNHENMDEERERHSEIGNETLPTIVNLPGKPSVKRKMRNSTSWKSYKRSKCYQAGEAYVNRRGKEVVAKKIKNLKNCVDNCKFKCGVNVSPFERESQFKAFYKMSQNEKNHFLLNTTSRNITERPKNKSETSYKKFSFKYFFNIGNTTVQVCKPFYLGTLSISQKPIYNVHKNKDEHTNTPKQDGRGKSANSGRRLSEEKRDMIKDHINSFPAVESHYCRSTTSRKYLDSNLSLVKMYALYKEKCLTENLEPVKLSMYRHIFVTEFNIDFHKRKSDRCDVCEEYRMGESQNTLSEEFRLSYEKHVKDKQAMRENRKIDRENLEVPVLCFDLQNVIACPRAEISSFFYKRKLNTYNLTAHFSQSKTVYCAIWTEAISGRSGNDISSALFKILNAVADEHEFTEIILWSDSCVPQNRNSFISCAVQNFLHQHSYVKKVTLKYSVPGHSCIQEVDNAHSVIEKGMRNNEFYSPLGLVRILKTLNRSHPIRVLQMREHDFFDFGLAAKTLNFKQIPFFQVSLLEFNQVLHEVSFKTSFADVNMTTVNLRFMQTKSRKCTSKTTDLGNTPVWKMILPNPLQLKPTLPADKVKDIKDMFKYMPLQDRDYYSVILKL